MCHGSRQEKGKEPMAEPLKKKKTRTQKEVERAAMAADDQAASHGSRLQIREPGARAEEQQGELVSLPPRRSLREHLRRAH
jgi:hypothetical protein